MVARASFLADTLISATPFCGFGVSELQKYSISVDLSAVDKQMRGGTAALSDI